MIKINEVIKSWTSILNADQGKDEVCPAQTRYILKSIFLIASGKGLHYREREAKG
jgi:hypothetical protein